MAEASSFVEVLYATPAEQRIVRVAFEDGMTARDAVVRSGLPRLFPEIGRRELVLGIFGTRVDPGQLLRAGQRVEICRPLRADPRVARRELAREGRSMGKTRDEL
jgi:uncharacterized protein